MHYLLNDSSVYILHNPQCAAVPLVAQDVISAPASQAAFVERLFSLWLTKGTRNRMEKNLCT